MNTNQKDFLKMLQYKLSEKKIDSHIPGIITDSREFIKQGKITLSTPRNSKGNEVPIVIVCNAEKIYTSNNKQAARINRNLLFISITRAKAMVKIFACDKSGNFIDEMNKILENYPKYKFIFPTKEQENELATIDLIMKNPEAREMNKTIEKLNKLLQGEKEFDVANQLLKNNPDLLEKLKEILTNDDKTKTEK